MVSICRRLGLSHVNSGALQVYQRVREAEKANLQDRAGGLCKEAGETEREREKRRMAHRIRDET